MQFNGSNATLPCKNINARWIEKSVVSSLTKISFVVIVYIGFAALRFPFKRDNDKWKKKKEEENLLFHEENK